MKRPLIFLLIILSVFSCRHNRITLEKTELFSLGLGKMEDELDLVYHDGEAFPTDTYIYMRNGLFYISNGSLNKVVEFTSYGDVLTAIYNPDMNPEPVSLIVQDENSLSANRKAYPYNFNAIDRAVTDSNKNLYVVDETDPSLMVYNKDENFNSKYVIRRFDKNGKYFDFIGYEGVGGSPFPVISSLQVLDSDELVVVLNWNNRIEVKLYSVLGDLVSSHDFYFHNLPMPEYNDLYASLDSLIADPENHTLYLKIDYFRVHAEEGKQSLYNSMIYIYSLDLRQFSVDTIEIPRITLKSEYAGSVQQEETSLVYTFLGVARGPYFYLYSEALGDELSLIILNSEGMVVSRSLLDLGQEEIVFKRFHLSPEGIISGLLLHEFSVEVCWWKSDMLLKDIDNDKSG